MKKILLGVTIIACSTVVNAHSNECNYSTDFNINIDQQSVLFKKKTGDSFEFRGEQLLINGDPVKLSNSQKQASKQFEAHARAMVPKIAVIAVEGAELGVKAATIVLGTLFGDDLAAQKDLMEPIEAMVAKIKTNIKDTQINTDTLEQSIEDAFDDEFERAIEKAATKYSGKIIGNVLSSIFSGDGEELKDLEFRLENMGQDIEKYVEENAEDLKVKAEALCEDMIAIDQFDDLLVEVKGYPKDGLIQKDKEHGFKISKLSLKD